MPVRLCHQCSLSTSSQRPLPAENRDVDADIPPEVIEEGSKLVEELLRTWAKSGPLQDSGDVVMTDNDDSPESQLAELRKCVETYRPRLEQNLWAQRLLENLA